MSDGGLRPVPPYLPSCADFSREDFQREFASRGTAFNLSNAGDYVYEQVVPSLIPGLVVGALALLGFIFFLLWLLVGCCASYCCCCCRTARRRQAAAEEAAASGATQQFIPSQDMPSSPYTMPGPGPAPAAPKMSAKAKLFWAFTWALGLALVGVCGWGLASSIDLTDTTVSNFWSLVDLAQLRVELTIESLQDLQNGTARLSAASQTLASNSDAVTQALEDVARAQGVPLPAGTAQQVVGVLVDVPSVLDAGSGYLGSAVDFLTYSINDTIADIEGDFKPPTMALEETWRFIPFAVIFGVTMLVTLVLLPLLLRMRWPKTVAFLVALLWLAIALLMLLGTGLLNGVYVVSSDACLFAETFVVDYVYRRTAGTVWGDTIARMVQYYIGLNETVFGQPLLPPAAVDSSPALQALQVYLPSNASQALGSLDTTLRGLAAATDQLAGVATDPELQAAVESAAGQQVADALGLAGVAVTSLSNSLGNLTSLANRSTVESIYFQTKEYLCCDLRGTSRDMWVAWTVAGCLGFALACLASGVLVHAARTKRKAMKAAPTAALGGGALWMKQRPNSFSQPSKGDEQQPPEGLDGGGGGAAASSWQGPPQHHQLFAATATGSGFASAHGGSGQYLGPAGAVAKA